MNTNYAGFWQRFLALIIDSIIIGIVRTIIVIPVLAAIGLNFASEFQNSELVESGDILN